jgi:hypothetical protein
MDLVAWRNQRFFTGKRYRSQFFLGLKHFHQGGGAGF